MSNNVGIPSEVRFAPCASQAEGVPKPDDKQPSQSAKWFIAMVPNNTEKRAMERLSSLGYDVFVLSQKYVSVWKDGRRKIRERILLPGKIIVRCTEKERMKIVELSFISRFMVDKSHAANSFGTRPLAVVPDSQIEQCRFMLGQTDVEVSFDVANVTNGTKVRITRGALAGLVGTVANCDTGTTHVSVNIDYLGCACVVVDKTDIELI